MDQVNYFYCLQDYTKSIGIVWSKKHYKAVKDCKKSVISKHNKHHGSFGEYFSFGNKVAYETVDGSSMGQYTVKKNTSIKQRCHIITIE